MIYISLSLIILGAIFLLYSFLSRPREVTSSAPFVHDPLDLSQKQDSIDELEALVDDKKPIETPDLFPEFDDPSVPGKTAEVTTLFTDEPRPAVARTAPVDELQFGSDEPSADEAFDMKPESLTRDKYTAVLFDDSSRILNYEANAGMIDATLEKYKNIKRIGKGEFSIEKNGINFNIDKKLYRYDFYRIDKIFTGKNYLALQVKGADSIKLFIMSDSDADTIVKTTRESYNSFIQQ
jgi:hypothetical protein